MKFIGKTALITGASTGIGREIALALARQGAKVILSARNLSGLEESQDQIAKIGGTSELLPIDLADYDDILKKMELFSQTNKQIDFLINVAGIWHGKDEVYAGIDFEKYDPKVIFDTLMVGAIAPALLVNACLPLMLAQSKIINISGTFEDGAKGWLPYFVSKRAIEDFTVGLADELKTREIQVNCISPSDTATEAYQKFFPQYMKDAIDPIEIAKSILELCDTSATGQVLVAKKGLPLSSGFHS